MVIGLTDTMSSEDKLNQYIRWLGNQGTTDKLILSYLSDNLSEVERCDALILTGGNDVAPELYDAPKSHPNIHDVDRKRDDFERKIIDKILKTDIPVLAICRGMQIINVHLGGTLIPDIEEAGYRSHRSQGGTENRHRVAVEYGTKLHGIVKVTEGIVNSSHHQAIKRPGEGLKVAASSDDGITEAMELSQDYGGRFFLLVQWHPERMDEIKNPFSESILQKFLSISSKHLKK